MTPAGAVQGKAGMAQAQLLFVHDHRFQRDDAGRYYTSGSFPSSIWPRYLEHFAHVTVLARDGGATQGATLARSDHAGVEFALLSDPGALERLGLRRGKAHRVLRDQIARADAVIARLPSDLGLQAASLAAEAGKPLLIEAVGCAYDSYANHGAWKARLYAPLAYLRMRAALARAPFALYVTNDWLQRRYPSAPHSVTAGVSDVVVAEPDAATRAARAARIAELAEGRRPVLGTVGSLRTAAKGFHVMFEALARLRRDHDLRLDYRILGGGDPARWRELAARAGVADQVHFDGVLPAGGPVLRWLDAIDIHVQPSFQEGLPRATIEAMSRGCACVGSSAGGLPELIDQPWLHRPGDSRRLAVTVAALAADPALIGADSARSLEVASGFAEALTAARRSEIMARLRAAVKAL